MSDNHEQAAGGHGPPVPPVPSGSSPPVISGISANTWAMACHLAGLTGLIFPVVGNICGPLVIWMMKKDTMLVVDRHGKEALNFQLSFALYSAIVGAAAAILLLVLVGIFLLPLLLVLYILIIIFPIIAGLKANDGGWYDYPLTIRFIK